MTRRKLAIIVVLLAAAVPIVLAPRAALYLFVDTVGRAIGLALAPETWLFVFLGVYKTRSPLWLPLAAAAASGASFFLIALIRGTFPAHPEERLIGNFLAYLLLMSIAFGVRAAIRAWKAREAVPG